MIWGYHHFRNPPYIDYIRIYIYGYIGYVKQVSTNILFDFLESYFEYLSVMFFWQERLERPAGLNEQVGRNDFLEKRNVSPKLTATAPENRPKPNRKGSYSNYLFSGANCSFTRVVNVSQE